MAPETTVFVYNMFPELIPPRGTAIVFVLYNLKTNQILVEERPFRDFYVTFKYGFPGGRVEDTDGVMFEDVLRREMCEELGVVPVDFLRVGARAGVVSENRFRLVPFLVTKWTGEIPEKILDHGNPVKWIDLDDETIDARTSAWHIIELVRQWRNSNVAQY